MPRRNPLTRPPVSVVVPFAGGGDAARVVLDAVAAALADADEIVFVDNNAAPVLGPDPRVVHAPEVASSYYARNRGAEAASREWIVFCDGDTRPEPGWLDGFFDPEPGARVAVLGGGIRDSHADDTFAARLQRERASMSANPMLAWTDHPYAITANCAVRAEPFRAIGGFDNRAISGGDADLCWRLAAEGWEIEGRPGAVVVHESRATMRAQWSQRFRHGRGAAWLEERFPGRLVSGGLARTGGRFAKGAVRAALRPRSDAARMDAAEASLWLAHEVGRLRSNRAPRR